MKMYCELKKFLSWTYVLLAVILAIGIFFRTYHYEDWLQFQSDEYRDALLVSHAVVEGPAALPLIGPRAGGTTLHLGAIFYYFQYVAGSIFQSTSPVVFAYPDLLFSILTILVAFFLFRHYFSSILSLALSGIIAVSFMAIEYGRFAWNPNATPFFTLIFCLALLKVYAATDTKKRSLWSAVLGGALAIATQLHFSAFLGLPIIFFLFVLFQRERTKEIYSWKVVGIFIGTICLFYLPYALNEWVTHGYNVSQFIDVVKGKGELESVRQNIIQNITMFSKYFLHISTGIVDGKAWQNILSTIFFSSMFLVNCILWYKETDANKRRFLLLSLLFVVVYFIVYIPLAFRIDRSRFFLPLLPLPFMFVGYAIVFLKNLGWRRVACFGGGALIFILVANNVRATRAWFENLDRSQQTEGVVTEISSPDGENVFWTWSYFVRAATYTKSTCSERALYFFGSKKVRKYEHSIEYALHQQDAQLVVETSQDEYDKGSGDNTRGCYFFISQPGASLPEYVTNEPYEKVYRIGTFQIVRWYPSDATRSLTPGEDAPDTQSPSLERLVSTHARLSWGDLFR